MSKNIQSVERAFRILEIFTSGGKEFYRVSDIAKILNLKISTTHSLLTTLLKLGYVRKCEDTKKYKLGDRFSELFQPYIQKNILLKHAELLMKKLAEKIKESVALAVFFRGERYTIATVSYENQVLTVNLNQFEKKCCYDVATGRILLSYLDEEELKEYIRKNGYPGKRWGNIRNLSQLKKEIEKIRKEKIAIRDGKEVIAVAVPVFGTQDKVVASLGVYLPSLRFKGENRKLIINELKKTGQKISEKLGGMNG